MHGGLHKPTRSLHCPLDWQIVNGRASLFCMPYRHSALQRLPWGQLPELPLLGQNMTAKGGSLGKVVHSAAGTASKGHSKQGVQQQLKAYGTMHKERHTEDMIRSARAGSVQELDAMESDDAVPMTKLLHGTITSRIQLDRDIATTADWCALHRMLMSMTACSHTHSSCSPGSLDFTQVVVRG